MPGREISAVVFDLGGVLIDWDPRHLYRTQFADAGEMEDFLGRICTTDWHRAHDLGADVTESCQQLARQHPGYRDMIMMWAEHGEQMAIGQFDETVEILREVTAGGTRCFALSNMEPETFVIRRSRFAFMNWFDGHVISGIEGVAKPDRRIFEILLSRHGLQPGCTLFIDDMARNVQAARELGIVSVQFSSAARLRQDLLALRVAGLRPA